MEIYFFVFSIIVLISFLGFFSIKYSLVALTLSYFIIPSVGILQPVVFIEILTIIVFLISKYTREFSKYILFKLNKSIILFMVLLVFILFVSYLINFNNVSDNYFFGSAINIISSSLYVVILLFIYNKIGHKSFFIILSYTLVFVVLFSFIEYTTFSQFYRFDYPTNARFVLTGFLDSNYSALRILLIYLIISYTYQITKDIKLLYFNIFLIVLIALTLSRAAWVLAIIIVMMDLYSYRENRKHFIFSFALILLFIYTEYTFGTIIKTILESELVDFIFTANSERLLGESDTMSMRTMLLESSLTLLSLWSFLFGLGTFDIPAYNYKMIGMDMSFHNFYITIFFQFGFLALLFVLLIYGTIFYKSYKLNDIDGTFLRKVIFTYFIFVLSISDEVGFFLFFILFLYVVLSKRSHSAGFK